MSADGVQVLLGKVMALRGSLDYMETRVRAVSEAVDSVSQPGRGQAFQRVQDHGVRSVASPSADQAHTHMGHALYHIEGATRYVDSWLAELLQLIDL